MPKKRVIHKEEKTIEPKPEEHTPPTIVTQIVEVVEGERPAREETRDVPHVTVTEHKEKPAELIEDASADEAPEPEDEKEPDKGEHPVAASYEEVVEENEEDKAEEKEKPAEEATEKQKQVVEELFSKREPGGLTEITIEKGKKGNKVFLWAFIVIVAAVTSGIGLMVLSGRESTDLGISFVKPSPTQTPAPTSAPTPAPSVDREDVEIQVLNGGGVPGAAGKMRTFLTDLGYNVSDVGNTEDYSWEETEILVKPGSEQILKMLEEDLKGEYSIGSSSATMSEDASYDARVIVGQK